MNPEVTPAPPETNINNSFTTSPTPQPSQDHFGTTAQPPSFKRPRLWTTGAVIVVIGITALATFFFNHSQSPNSLFDTALNNALQTRNFTQTNSDVASPSYVTIQYDVSDPANTKVQSEGKLTQGDTLIKFNGYGTFKDSFIKFPQYTAAGKSVPPAALNKWLQIRENSFDASNGYFAMLFQNDPHSAFFGDLIFGNFSTMDRSKLMDYLHQHPVYKFDTSKVKHQTYKGQAVSVYEVTEDQKALGDYNKFVGNMIGLSASQLSQDLDNTHFAGTAKLYISESAKRFVHIEVSSARVDYYDHGTTKLGSAPASQMTFEQFENLAVTE